MVVVAVYPVRKLISMVVDGVQNYMVKAMWVMLEMRHLVVNTLWHVLRLFHHSTGRIFFLCPQRGHVVGQSQERPSARQSLEIGLLEIPRGHVPFYHVSSEATTPLTSQAADLAKAL